MPADKRLIECPSCYATKGQYHKPGCPALTPPAGPATACLCGSPYADWTANGKLMCARCAANFVVASRFSADPAAVPPPEWAVEMARNIGREFFYPDDVNDLARLLASVREGALREAADLFPKGGGPRTRILSLLHTPPSGGGVGSVADELFRGAPEGRDDPV